MFVRHSKGFYCYLRTFHFIILLPFSFQFEGMLCFISRLCFSRSHFVILLLLAWFRFACFSSFRLPPSLLSPFVLSSFSPSSSCASLSLLHIPLFLSSLSISFLGVFPIKPLHTDLGAGCLIRSALTTGVYAGRSHSEYWGVVPLWRWGWISGFMP